MGRRRFQLTDEQQAQVEKLAGVLTVQQLADFFEVSSRTLRRRMTDDPIFATAYRKGRARVIASVAGALLKEALKGNVAACALYLKTQAGWREADPSSVQPADISKLTDAELEKRKRKLGLIV